jgi:carbonic anhydrase/acetyltransferase-like protein (isoleucine patch superfamily)
VGERSELPFEGIAPRVAPGAFVAPGAVLVGDVTLGEGSSVWYNAVVRADREAVRIGRFTNVQDNCTLHADPGYPAVLGNHVTVGHGAVVHGATVEDEALIGIGATVLNGAVVGRGSVVGVGAVITEGTQIPPGVLALGLPARVVRGLTPEELEANRRRAVSYAELAGRHAALH